MSFNSSSSSSGKMSDKLKNLMLSTLKTSSSDKSRDTMQSVSAHVVKESGVAPSITKEDKEAIVTYLSQEEFSVEFSQTQFKRCDEYLAECKKFVEEAVETITFTNKANSANNDASRPLAMGAAKINKWRSKQKQNNLYNRYDSVVVSSDSCDVTLTFMTEKALTNISMLVTQCQHLKPRLQACVHFNTRELEHQSPVVRETSLVLDVLKESEHTMRTMLQFYDEVGSMQAHEERVKQQQKQAYVPWALRNVVQKEEVPAEPKPDPIKRKTLEKRAKKIQKMIKTVDTNLTAITSEYGMRKENFERCTKALQTMEGIMKKLVMDHDIDIDESDDEEEEEDSEAHKKKSEPAEKESRTQWLDSHALLCGDCSLTFVMVNECLITLATNQIVAMEATRRTQKLLALRERIGRYAGMLEDMDWGSKAAENSPVKESSSGK